MKYKIAIGFLILLTLLTFSSACVVVVTNAPPNYYGTGNYTDVPTYYQTVLPKAELQIIKNELTEDAAGNAIGLVTVKNISSYTAELAEVTGKFYDSSMNLVYQSTDAVINLAPGEMWDFTFTCSGANCDRVTTFTVDVTYGGGN